jgi:hypothetical protein
MLEKQIVTDQEQKLNIVVACKKNLQTVFDNLKVIHEQLARVKEDTRLLKLDNYYMYTAFSNLSESINHLEDAIANFGVGEDVK